MYDYLIVGAGLFGATFAYEMAKKGKKCLVIDRRNHIGGNVFTENIKGIDMHKYGAHIFHTSNKRIWDYVNDIVEFEPFVNSPLAVYKNEIYNLPFNMNTFAKIWNITTPEQAKNKIKKEKQIANITNPTNLEEQAISLVGNTIYNKLIKGYTEKQWGKKCKDLPPEIIKRLPVRYTYNNNYFNDKFQGIPKDGYTNLICRMLRNCDIILGCDYLKEEKKYDKIADKILYTGAIDEFFDYCFGELEYRSLRFENEILDMDNYQGNAVVNYTEYEVPYTRIIEHKHFTNKETRQTVITKEYPQEWNKNIEPYYPINDTKNNNLYNKYKDLANKNKKVIFGGRLGLYQYLDMDKTIEKALELVKKELIENG